MSAPVRTPESRQRTDPSQPRDGAHPHPVRGRPALPRNGHHGAGTVAGRASIATSTSGTRSRRNGSSRHCTPRLLPITRDWHAKPGDPAPWPGTLHEWLRTCHDAGQD
jgi:hypothetical protein